MEDLRSTIDSTISSESEDSDQNATVVPAKPKLTARERLRLKKMQEADKRAYDLKYDMFVCILYVCVGVCVCASERTVLCESVSGCVYVHSVCMCIVCVCVFGIMYICQCEKAVTVI